MLVQADLIGAMPAAPETVAVAGLVDGDAIDPGPQAGLSAEAVDGAEDPQEDFLRQIEGLVTVAEEVQGELEHHALVFRHELGAGRLVAVRTALNKRGLTAADVRPADDPGLLHRHVHYTSLDPGGGAKFRPACYDNANVRRTIAFGTLFAAAAVALALANQIAVRQREYRAQLRRGDAALRGDDTYLAIEAYSGAIALRPDSMLAHLRRGETYRRRADHGDLELAARDFRKAADLDAAATRPLEELGDVLYHLERYDRAEEAYDRFLRLDDRSARISYKLGLVRFMQGRVSQALAGFDQTLLLDGRFADAHYMRGVCLRELQRPVEAIKAFERAVSLAPAMIAAREELADLYAASDRRADQLEQLQLLAGLDRNQPARQAALALANARARRWDAAVMTLGTALERTRDPALYSALGEVWLESAQLRGDPVELRKAREALEPVASTPAASSHALLLAGRAALDDGDVENAERSLRQACERFPLEPAALLLYATVAERRSHFDEARRALIQYEALAPVESDDVAHATRIATLSLRVNDASTAAAWIARGLSRDPQNPALLALSKRVSTEAAAR
jgi:tetratricopeptide (TPR) repeat protein